LSLVGGPLVMSSSQLYNANKTIIHKNFNIFEERWLKPFGKNTNLTEFNSLYKQLCPYLSMRTIHMLAKIFETNN
jgi:hypothetical protein